MAPYTDPAVERGMHLLDQFSQSREETGTSRRKRPAQVSPCQETLLIAQDMHPDQASGNVTRSWKLSGALDIDALERALQDLVGRHDALRMEIRQSNGRTTPQFRSELRISLRPEKVPGTTPEEKAQQIDARIADRSLHPLPLTGAPLWQARLFEIDDRSHVLMICMHHLICDDWSWRILARDLFALYRGEAENGSAQLAATNAFEDYLSAIADRTATQPAGQFPDLDWPVNSDATSARPDLGLHLASRQLDARRFDALKELARLYHCTPFFVFLSAYALLLARLCDQPATSIAVSVSDRTGRGFENSLGLYLKVVPVALDIAGKPTFADLLTHSRDAFREAETREQGNRVPVNVTINYYNAPDLGCDGGTLDVHERPRPPRASAAQLNLGLCAIGGGMQIAFEGQHRIFSAVLLERMADAFVLLLNQIADNPGVAIDDLDLVATDQRRALAKRSVNQAFRTFETDIPARFAQIVSRNPAAGALCIPGSTQSYADLDAHSNALARWLRARGFGDGDRLGVALPRGGAVFRTWLAALKAGLTVVPIDAEFPQARVQHILQTAGCRAMVTARPPAPGSLAWSGRILMLPGVEELAAYSGAAIPAGPSDPQRDAFVMFTSGTTGAPKSIPVSHAGIVRLISDARHMPVGPGDRVIQLSSPGFDGSFVEVWGAWLNGAELALFEKPVLTEGGAEVELRSLAPNAGFITTSLFNLIVDSDVAALQSFRHLSIGGEAASNAHAQRALAAHPQLKLFNIYGPTENSAFTTSYQIRAETGPSVPIGRPLPMNMAFVLSQSLRPLPDGFAGELLIGGPGLSSGYENRPDLTAERFVHVPAKDLGISGDEPVLLYRTGDRARWNDDGQIEFLGRRDSQFKLHGYRIEPGEIEAALMEHPAIGRAAVLPEMRTGQNTIAGIAAFFDTVCAPAPTASELRSFLATRLPRPMMPTRYIRVDRIPLTPNGKTDRLGLSGKSEYLAPDLAAEDRDEDPLTAAMQKALGRLDIPDDASFFDLGGTSISLARMISEVEKAFDVSIDLATLFRDPSLRRLRSLVAFGKARSRESLRHLHHLSVLRDGDEELPPVVIFPGVSGNTDWSAEILSHLFVSNPVLGFSFDAPENGSIPEGYFADLLQAFRRDLDAFKPKKPVILVGFSFGGTLVGHLAGALGDGAAGVDRIINIDGGAPLGRIPVPRNWTLIPRAALLDRFQSLPVRPFGPDIHLVMSRRGFPFSRPSTAEAWTYLTTGHVHEYDFDTYHHLFIRLPVAAKLAETLGQIISGRGRPARSHPSRCEPDLLLAVNRAARLASEGALPAASDLIGSLRRSGADDPDWMQIAHLTLMNAGKDRDGLDRFLADCEGRETSPPVWQALANCYGPKRKLQILGRCFAASGEQASGALPLVDALLGAGRQTEAQRVANQLAASPRRSIEATIAAAVLRMHQGAPELSFQTFAKALSGPDVSSPHFQYCARFLARHGQSALAGRIVDLGRGQFPGDMHGLRQTLGIADSGQDAP